MKTNWKISKLQLTTTHFLDVMSNDETNEARAYMYTNSTRRVQVFYAKYNPEHNYDIVWETYKDCFPLIVLYDSFVNYFEGQETICKTGDVNNDR